MNKLKGTVLTLLSAVIFGSTAVLCKIATAYGSNYAMLTLTRMFFSIPILWFIVKKSGHNFKITKKELVQVIILCAGGSLATTLVLYASYNFIPVGIATTLHFTYPALVCIISMLFFKEKASVAKIFAIILSSLGVLMFLNGEIPEKGAIGIALAGISGLTYCFYILYMDKSKLSNWFAYKLSFYICVVNSVLMFVYAQFTSTFTLQMSWQAWVLQIIISLSTSVLGISFLQIGIRSIGPSNASLFSLFEPISGIVLGAVILRESCDMKTIIGCALIIIAVGVLSKDKSH